MNSQSTLFILMLSTHILIVKYQICYIKKKNIRSDYPKFKNLYNHIDEQVRNKLNPCIALIMLYWYAIYTKQMPHNYISDPNILKFKNIYNHIDEQVVLLWLWYTDTQLQSKLISFVHFTSREGYAHSHPIYIMWCTKIQKEWVCQSVC